MIQQVLIQHSFGLEGISAANQKIKDVATGTDDTDAVNVKQLKDTVW